jgi:hypothetical protein
MGARRVLSQGVKRPGSEADRSVTSAEVHSPIRFHGVVLRDSLTFLLPLAGMTIAMRAVPASKFHQLQYRCVGSQYWETTGIRATRRLSGMDRLAVCEQASN